MNFRIIINLWEEFLNPESETAMLLLCFWTSFVQRKELPFVVIEWTNFHKLLWSIKTGFKTRKGKKCLYNLVIKWKPHTNTSSSHAIDLYKASKGDWLIHTFTEINYEGLPDVWKFCISTLQNNCEIYALNWSWP